MLWGATFVIARDTLRSLSPLELVATRFALAALLWLPVLAARRLLGGGPRSGARAAVVGGLVSAPPTAASYLFQAIGLTDTSAGSSAFLTCVGPLLTGLVAWPMLGPRPGRMLIAGIALGAAGAALLGVRDGLHLGAGERWTLLGALAFAFQIVLVGRWIGGADTALLAAVQTAATALLLLPLAGSLPARLATLEPGAAAGLAYLAVVGSFVAPLLQLLAQRRITPGRIGLLFALEPVFALVFALLLGGERFVLRWWIGAALILAAVLMVEIPASRPSRSPPASA